MARRRRAEQPAPAPTRRKKGEGAYWYDKKTQRHCYRIIKDRETYEVKDRDPERAKAEFETLKLLLSDKRDIQGGKQALRTFFRHYLDTVVVNEVRASTLHNYEKRGDYYILPTLGDYSLVSLKRAIIQAWVNAMLDDTEWSLSSIRQALRLLKRSLDVAVEEKLIDDNPAAGIKPPTRRRGDEKNIDAEDELHARVPTKEEVDRILAAVLHTDRYHGLYPLYVLATRLGLRRGELLGLRWKDVDFEKREIRVRQQVIRMDSEVAITLPKTDSARREIPMPDDVVQMMRELKLRSGRAGGLVFPNKDGDARQPNGIDQHFRRTCKRLGITGLVFHGLRKYAVTTWRATGTDLEVAAALAGHKGIKVTAETYSDATMERKRAAIERSG